MLAKYDTYLLFNSRVLGPYGQLWTEFFSFFLWPKREARGSWKQGRKKTRILNLPYGPSKRG